ncbi:hypothetical protein F2P45_23450 [Massilia sp. CCM 8733]|uniref:Uncharacterized protein n=2 Tax=Massilia mucilaginosa TaxID=2609282 RepID=A0ABX0NY78_9BURK|nr:hypothetical protein [Massilia mucilaginosa]
MAMDNIIGLEKSPGTGGDKMDSVAERKARLLRQGDFYRVGIAHAKARIKHDARPDVLFHSALDHATWAVRSRIDSVLHPTGISVASIMPYAATIVGFITRRRLIKPALGVAAVLGGLAWYLQQRRTGQAQEL